MPAGAAERAIKEELSLPRFVHLVCQRSRSRRRSAACARASSSPALPGGKTLEPSTSPSSTASTGARSTCWPPPSSCAARRWGPPAWASPIWRRAARQGGARRFSVAFMGADHLVDVVCRDEAADGRGCTGREYMTTSLLIIDELGFQALDRREATCCSRSSTIDTCAAAPRSPPTRASANGRRCWPATTSWPRPSWTATTLLPCPADRQRSFRLRDMEQQFAQDR